MLVERGLMRSASNALQELIPSHSKVFIVSSDPILNLWKDPLSASFGHDGRAVEILTMPDGESAKRFASVEKLAASMVRLGADRRSVVVAFGGGVVGDVGGFLASIFMRGIPVIQVPTTLVAQVDSAIGGKTGVNLTSGKNLVGTFHQPLAVLADPDVLSTLPEREYRSGLFEAMKYGVIRNPEIFDLMEAHRDGLLRREGELLEQLIVECVKIKAAVVSADEREGGERRVLNFGHTIGHALESATQYRHFLHGEAVAWGMVAAAMIGQEMKITGTVTAQRIVSLVCSYGSLPEVKVAGRRILKLLQSDKKTMGGVPHFILATGIGSVQVVNTVPASAILAAMKEIGQRSQLQ
ncbi:MAG TPA: 3-dehydroquinate synthase [Candidatus Eisenbacteria bacterium]|nr:3-dehydroquinate synthase [Candidatus Eisenbacteria bacterium]